MRVVDYITQKENKKLIELNGRKVAPPKTLQNITMCF